MGSTVFDEQFLRGGLRLHFRDWAGPDPGAPAIVLLHGYTGHARSWDGLAAVLSDRYRVLVPDARGHGESSWDPPGGYGVDQQVGDVVALLGALGVERASVLGLSMGGRTAFNLAAAQPGLVERLVIVDIGPQVAAAGAARIGAGVAAGDVFDTPEDAVAQYRAGNPNAAVGPVRHRVRHNLLLRDDGRWTWRYDPALRGPGGSNLPRPDPDQQWAALERITAPTLLVRGEVSDVLDRDDGQRMAQVMPDCTLVEVAGAGHTVPLDRPDGFLDAIRGFLAL